MADNQEKQMGSDSKKPWQKRNGAKSSRNGFGINTLFLVINLLLLGLLCFQIFQITKIYSEKSKTEISRGKKIIINATNNEVESLNLSEEEIKAFNPDIKKASDLKKSDSLDLGDGLIGPPAPSAEQIAANYSEANLSVIVTDLGQTKSGLSLAGALPKEVSFAFSPYSDDLQNKMTRTIADGREVLLNLILEPSGFPLKDSGPLTILTSADKAQNQTKFDKTAAEYTGYIGFLSNSGEVLTNNLEVVTPTLNNTKDAQKFFGYYRSAANTYLENDVKPMAVDIVVVDYLIDETISEKDIRKKLDQAKSDMISKKKKVVIALRPFKLSVDVLQRWLKENLGENIRIAPISYFVTDN